MRRKSCGVQLQLTKQPDVETRTDFLPSGSFVVRILLVFVAAVASFLLTSVASSLYYTNTATPADKPYHCGCEGWDTDCFIPLISIFYLAQTEASSFGVKCGGVSVECNKSGTLVSEALSVKPSSHT